MKPNKNVSAIQMYASSLSTKFKKAWKISLSIPPDNPTRVIEFAKEIIQVVADWPILSWNLSKVDSSLPS